MLSKRKCQTPELLQVIISREEDYSLEPVIYPVKGGVLEITLPRISSILLKAVPIRKRKKEKARSSVRGNIFD